MTSNLVIPEGRATGCLPRVSEPGKLCAFLSERVPIIPSNQWAEYIGQVSLTECVRQILDQDGVGSCATESTTQGVHVTREWSGQPFELLNPWFIYYHTSGGADRGSSIDQNLAFVRDRGIAPERVWPRSKGWRTRPSDEAYQAALEFTIDEFYDCTTIAEIGSALLRGFAVVFGWNGHSCLLTELLTVQEARYANSWGVQWGDAGFGRIRLASINFAYGAFAVRATKVKE